MTATVPEDRPADVGPKPPTRDGAPWWRRALDAYLYGNQFVVTVLAFVVALVFGAILIAIADEHTRTSLGYFFQVPSDTFSNAWKAISAPLQFPSGCAISPPVG